MKNIVLFVLILFALPVSAAGGLWFLEVEYESQKENGIVYIFADHWAKDIERTYVNDDDAFYNLFMEKYGAFESINAYNRIHINDTYVEGTAFYMHPFYFKDHERKIILLENLEKVCLKKVWAKTDVAATTFNKFSVSDKNWLKDNSNRIYSSGGGGKDAIRINYCAIDIYDFGHRPEHLEYIERLRAMTDEKGNISSEDDRLIRLVEEMTTDRVVLHSVCGC